LKADFRGQINRLGYSIEKENQTFGKSIDEMCSVYTAEAKAIFDACLILKNFSHRRVAIATDSLSNLKRVLNPGNWDRLISWIRHFIYSSSHIQLVWIPGHTGLLGNVNADAEAKRQLLKTK
jgi:ribonuclease HI